MSQMQQEWTKYIATTNCPTQAIWLRKMPSETYIVLYKN